MPAGAASLACVAPVPEPAAATTVCPRRRILRTPQHAAGGLVEAAQSGLMADQLATEIVNELTGINISMFNTEGLDNMLL